MSPGNWGDLCECGDASALHKPGVGCIAVKSRLPFRVCGCKEFFKVF